jgi:Na+/H+-translocating membrane pyrophosphatase
VTPRRVVATAALVAALVAGAVVLLQWPLEKALVLAPVMVATVGATAFIVVLWVKIAYEGLSAQRHPLRIVGAGLLALAALVVLSFFVDLPATH